jgi:CheY-like chemotaxis protein/two-component sensor histidine kinase
MNEREQADASNDDALALANRSIAHELRNVFSVINACAVDLYDAMYGRAAGSLVLEILNAAERGLTVTTDLMRTADGADDDRRPTDLRRQLTDLEPMLRRLATPGVTLELQCSGDAVFAQIDRTGVMQIMMNLVANATDAMNRRGTITVSCGRGQRPGAMGREVVEVATVSVSDTGPGMSPEVAARVFDDGFSTKSGAHCGLGLAVVRRVVERCGGWVSVDSVPGKGSTFTVEFPLVAAPTSGISLVVVADDAARALVVEALAGDDVHVVQAADVLEACDLMAGQHIADIAVLDADAAEDRGLWHLARLRHVARTCAVGGHHHPLPTTVVEARALVAACTRPTLHSPIVETPVPSPPPEWQRRSPIP